MYRYFFKNVIDFVVAAVAFIILLPVFIIVTIVLFISNNGRPFFTQTRPGKNERLFKVIKFKTMNDKKDAGGNLLPDSKRLTPMGSFVRKTSLDEIPQLLNIISGSMSLIGPRPLLIKYLPYYTDLERKRFLIKPGITGWAQINGRNTAGWDLRLGNDVYYVDNMSFGLDMLIVYKTIVNIFSSKNIVVDPSSYMLDLDQERKDRI